MVYFYYRIYNNRNSFVHNGKKFLVTVIHSYNLPTATKRFPLHIFLQRRRMGLSFNNQLKPETLNDYQA